MSHDHRNQFPRRFGRSLVVSLWVAALLGVPLFSGCGRDETPVFGAAPDDVEQLSTFVKNTYQRANYPVEVRHAVVRKMEPISKVLYRLEFSAEAEVVRPVYIQLDRKKLLDVAGWNQSAYTAAFERLGSLPPLLAERIRKNEPPIDGNTRFFRREGEEGQQLKFDGRCTARYDVSRWHFDDLDVREVGGLTTVVGAYDLNNLRIENLPPNSMLIDGKLGPERIRRIVEGLDRFVSSVNDAEKNLSEATRKEIGRLASIAEPGSCWTARIADGNLPAQEWIVEFIRTSQETDSLKVRIRHPTDLMLRRVFAGRIVAPAPAPAGAMKGMKPAGPVVALEPLDQGANLFQRTGREALTIDLDTTTNVLRLRTDQAEATLTRRTGADALPDEDVLWTEVLAKVRPGTQWTGTAQAGLEAVTDVRLTFVELRPDGSYLRALAESPDDPRTAVVFEGVIDRRALHTWPIVLRPIEESISEGRRRDFYSDPYKSPLMLTLHENGLAGRRAADVVRLTASRNIAPWSDRLKGVAEVFRSGTRLIGTTRSAEHARDAILTIAEVRDNGAYVRVVAQAKDDPYDCAIYEGRMPYEGGLIDGYALKLKKRRGGLTQSKLFDSEIDLNLELRLALEGNRVIGILRTGGIAVEDLLLDYDPAQRTAGTPTREFGDLARRTLTKGSTWRGPLLDVAGAMSVEVTLKVLEAGGADNYTIELMVPRIAGGRAVYQGVLTTDDVSVNAHCLKLQKTKGGLAAKSMMFDAEIGDARRLKLMLAPDGATLYGYTTDGFSAEPNERLMLRLVATAKPPTGAPSGTAPRAAGSATGGSSPSSLLRPVVKP